MRPQQTIDVVHEPLSPEQLQEQIRTLNEQVQDLAASAASLSESAGLSEPQITGLSLFHEYIGVFIVAFLVTLLITPVMRRLAVANGIVDRPSETRKVHRIPIAYLGGVAVYFGLVAAILFSYTEPYHNLINFHETNLFDDSLIPRGVPLSILAGMTIITIIGLIDDVMGIDPRAKIAGQLIAAAALAYTHVGTKVAAGLLLPIAATFGIPTETINGAETLLLHIPTLGLLDGPLSVDVIYWTGTGIIALFVLGGCNASNLIDGLDGLLTGVTAITAAGLLVLALGLALLDNGTMDAARIVLCLALLGATLGFLPHNFNPAVIFLGDTGSMLLGFTTVVIILTLGNTGLTHLVIAGLIIYAVPIMDTTLAIFRRKIAGHSISAADDQHLHHMLKRAVGVKGAVFILYSISAGFAVLGIVLSQGRGRVTYAIVLLLAAFIGVTALKIARRDQIEQQAREGPKRRKGAARSNGVPITQDDAPVDLHPGSPEPAAREPVEARR